MGDEQQQGDQHPDRRWLQEFGDEMKKEVGRMISAIGTQKKKKKEKEEDEKAPRVASKGSASNGATF
ncbi:unnamed protein product [Caenorhabditis sp. 36 PRJEB53466]|nr:unnamed protein product [Caenorhabditis sp. 36 PRJEB53466]